ncbi:uL30 family ribosomal protein [Candidatus Woesearchaeota archaeon]|nr:uL30 family ribosomal protein [Candidatus Woesearchaeota archaeon]
MNKKPTTSESSKLAVVLVRGLARLASPVEDTLTMLNLTRKNMCIVIDNNATNKGMLSRVKDFITWGEIDKETFEELVSKRGKDYLGQVTDRKNLYHYKYLEFDGKKFKKYFTLNPPRKGFGRKGIKIPFKAGGALGYRGEKINDLIKRMI